MKRLKISLLMMMVLMFGLVNTAFANAEVDNNILYEKEVCTDIDVLYDRAVNNINDTTNFEQSGATKINLPSLQIEKAMLNKNGVDYTDQTILTDQVLKVTDLDNTKEYEVCTTVFSLISKDKVDTQTERGDVLVTTWFYYTLIENTDPANNIFSYKVNKTEVDFCILNSRMSLDKNKYVVFKTFGKTYPNRATYTLEVPKTFSGNSTTIYPNMEPLLYIWQGIQNPVTKLEGTYYLTVLSSGERYPVNFELITSIDGVPSIM